MPKDLSLSLFREARVLLEAGHCEEGSHHGGARVSRKSKPDV